MKLCICYAHVEDTMDPPIDLESRLTLTDSVSIGSKTNYICFSLHNQFCLGAVLLETKKKYHPNAIAQLIGYYIKSHANVWKPAVYILLTESILQVVLFPFYNKRGTPLVIALSP